MTNANSKLSEIKVICFDLGGVLVRLRSGVSKELVALCPAHRREELTTLLRDDFIHAQQEYSLNERYQLGQVSTAEYVAHVLSVFENTLDEQLLRAKALSVIAGDFEESTVLLPRLLKNYRLACFSNTHDLHWEHIRERFQWMGHFELSFASHLTGKAKPHPDSFHSIVSAAGVTPSECLFIDDRIVNIEGAQAVGMHGLLCADPARLEEALLQRGVAL